MMEAHMENNKLVIMTKRKTYFVLSKNVGKNLKHEIDTAIKNIEFLTK